MSAPINAERATRYLIMAKDEPDRIEVYRGGDLVVTAPLSKMALVKLWLEVAKLVAAKVKP